MRRTPGVAEATASGGYERQILIMPDPQRLLVVGMRIDELAAKLSENTRRKNKSIGMGRIHDVPFIFR